MWPRCETATPCWIRIEDPLRIIRWSRRMCTHDSRKIEQNCGRKAVSEHNHCHFVLTCSLPFFVSFVFICRAFLCVCVCVLCFFGFFVALWVSLVVYFGLIVRRNVPQTGVIRQMRDLKIGGGEYAPTNQGAFVFCSFLRTFQVLLIKKL